MLNSFLLTAFLHRSRTDDVNFLSHPSQSIQQVIFPPTHRTNYAVSRLHFTTTTRPDSQAAATVVVVGGGGIPPPCYHVGAADVTVTGRDASVLI